MNNQFDELTKSLAQSVTRRAALKKFGVGLAGMALACFGLANPLQAAGPTFTSFDYPGAVSTDGVGINRCGDIVGHYVDPAGIDHGYLLHKGGFVTIDFPGGSGGHAHGINSGGAIVGEYFIGKTFHGYLLSDGVFTEIDFPGAQNTRANGINSAGEIAGSYVDNNGNNNTGGSNGSKGHGFLLSGRVFTTIDFPGATYTEAWRINDNGQIVGRYQSGDGNFHVYLLTVPSGTFTSIDYPGATTAVGGFTQMGGLNNNGDIASDYCNSSNCGLDTAGALHGFVLSGGVFTSLDMPGAAATVAFGINDRGVIVGGYIDSNLRVHGLLRTP